MTHLLITPPTAEPVTLEEVKAHLVVTTDADDTLLLALLTAAREYVESPGLNRALLTQTWEVTLDQFPHVCQQTPHGELLLPRPPLQSVTSVKYYDGAGVQQTLPVTDYYVDVTHEPGRIAPTVGLWWPLTLERIAAVTVRYVAGWTTVSLVPRRYKQAILFLLAHWYENREPLIIGSIPARLDFTLESLLSADRIGIFA